MPAKERRSNHLEVVAVAVTAEPAGFRPHLPSALPLPAAVSSSHVLENGGVQVLS
jgi:hypothetical protein